MDLQLLQFLTNPLDANAQSRALAYFEQLKSSDTGWQLATNTLINTNAGSSLNDHVKFFALQVIEVFIKQSYQKSSPSQQQAMKHFLSQWIQLQVSQPVQDKVFIRNKAAQIFALVFVCDYPKRWPNFFTDLLQTLSLGPNAIDLYLRVLLAIDSEVVDREILHSKEEADRNTLIKDHMRETCVESLVDSWYHILSVYETSNTDLVCQTLEIVGAYIAWINIDLIANMRFVDLLVRFLREQPLREAAADCLHDIVAKGMDPVAKTKLVESLFSVLDSAGILNVDMEDDVDYLCKLARLINCIGLQLALSWTKLKKAGDNDCACAVMQLLESKIPLTFRFLSHSDDDVSATVMDFVKEYIQLLKQKPAINEAERQKVESLLFIIFEKTKYDEGFYFDRDGEEEAIFLEYRKQLRTLFDNVAVLDRDLVLNRVRDLVNMTLPRWQTSSFSEVEAALTFLYQLGEALPVSHGNHFSGDPAKASALQPMMESLLSCGVSSYPHPAVTLCFFELVVRYEKFFLVEPQFVAPTLVAFLDQGGMRHANPKVRSRVAYLFSRFVRAVKSHMTDYTEDVLRRLQDLLILLPAESGPQTALLTHDDQLFIFETAGLLITSGNFDAETKRNLMDSLVSPVLEKFAVLLEELIRLTPQSPNTVGAADAANQKRRAILAQCLSHAMSAVAWSSKAFTNSQSIKASGCLSVYLKALEVFLRAIQLPEVVSEIQAGLRQYLHRMTVCLGEELLPFVPSASQVLLKSSSVHSLSEYIPLINQIIAKFKKQVVPFLNQAFAPIISAIFNALAASSAAVNDEEARLERQSLQRSYFSFIAAIVGSGLMEVLAAQDSAVLQQVLVSLVQGAVDYPDPVAQKTCFSTLRRLVEIWGGKDGPSEFVEFVYKQIVPACFLAPLRDTFDLNDAQTTMALSESALCLRAILEKRGDEELITFLQSQYLPTLKLNLQQSQEFCMALRSDQKLFKSYYKMFFQQARGL